MLMTTEMVKISSSDAAKTIQSAVFMNLRFRSQPGDTADSFTGPVPLKLRSGELVARILGRENQTGQHLCDARVAIIEHAERPKNAGKLSVWSGSRVVGITPVHLVTIFGRIIATATT